MYYAGLAGQDVDVDWRRWYRNRMAGWSVELDASLCLVSVPEQMKELDQGSFDRYEDLPAYCL